MTQLRVGQRTKVRHEDGGFKYTLDVEVRQICSSDEFIGRVESVFAAGDGEITGGSILDLKGQDVRCRNADIVRVQ